MDPCKIWQVLVMEDKGWDWPNSDRSGADDDNAPVPIKCSRNYQ